MENLDKAKISGLEIQHQLKHDDWTVKTALTILDPEVKKDGDPEYQQLNRRARQELAISVDHQLGVFSLGGTLKARSHAYDDATNNTRIPGHGTVNLRGSWQINKEVKAGVKLVNIFDKTYASQLNPYPDTNYVEEPRGIFATLTWSPKI